MLNEIPNRNHWVDDEQDKFISPEQVAEAMLLLVESEDYPGGTILEVLREATRKVTIANDIGTDRTPGVGSSLSNAKRQVGVITQALQDGSWVKN
ncbi:hypothetical protein NLG97_g5006 [Lecanicillium saksenae]|uniref:Uncharacterized protein n=1 Tax=Lecanicillium saksenae TaxID=468837 RepID=A0ACC1QTN0_9HYPO|nr:hypothetical protein NLG97_g5006 [Lecanicillium saksenae]